MLKFAINGFYNPGGQERFLFECLRELDKICCGVDIIVVAPKNKKLNIELKNIPIVYYGKKNKLFWVQFSFFRFLKKNKRIGINVFNVCPLFRPDIMFIHDLTPLIYKKLFTGFKGKLSYLYGELCRKAACKHGIRILTVSHNSKKDILKYYHIPEEKVVVIGNAWQHMQRIEEDASIFEKNPSLKKGEYYLSVGSLAPHKNFRWIKEVAARNKDFVFAVVGSKISLTTKEDKIIDSENLFYLGKVDDGELKALMSNCKAYIHPALYEGFGIPPMEALSVGAPVLVANTSCLPEIYNGSVHYFEPFDYDVDLEKLLSEPVDSPDSVLKKYSWKRVAMNLLSVLKEVEK